MRALNREEAEAVIRRCKWAGICTVTEQGAPYAVEATPFFMEGRHCFMINPRGGTWKNMRHANRVLLKYTLASENLDFWAGVSCFGRGEFVADKAAQAEGWRLLGLVMGEEYSEAARRFARCADRSPLFCVTVEEVTGRCSAAKGEALILPHQQPALISNRPSSATGPEQQPS